MPKDFSGKWDVTVNRPDLSFPSWFELFRSGDVYSGQFVGIWGSARIISQITVNGDHIAFRLPPQYEGFESDLVFQGQLDHDVIRGVTNTKDGALIPFVAERAPEFPSIRIPQYGPPVDLLANGLDDWIPRSPAMANYWRFDDGNLINEAIGTDLVSREVFMDFRLEIAYSYAPKSNSGIYLRGRYEVQVLDDYGSEPSLGSSGAVYGFLRPFVNAVRPAGEVNHAVIELVGREVSVNLNGTDVISHREIPGITGGALNSAEGTPGPLMLQGDHSSVTYHQVQISPRID